MVGRRTALPEKGHRFRPHLGTKIAQDQEKPHDQMTGVAQRQEALSVVKAGPQEEVLTLLLEETPRDMETHGHTVLVNTQKASRL